MLGVIVFAHGSRDPLWRQPVESVAQQIARRRGDVGLAEFEVGAGHHGRSVAARQLVAQGVTRVRVLPLFFGMGKHAREDLPVLMAQLAATHPAVTFEQLPAAGEDPRLTALLAQIALETAA